MRLRNELYIEFILCIITRGNVACAGPDGNRYLKKYDKMEKSQSFHMPDEL